MLGPIIFPCLKDTDYMPPKSPSTFLPLCQPFFVLVHTPSRRRVSVLSDHS